MFKFFRNAILACGAVLILPGNAAAEFSAVEFLKKYDAATGNLKNTYLQYLNGTSNGLSWANSLVERDNPKAKIYCPPRKSKLNATQTLALLRKYVAKHSKRRKAPVGAAMMFALQNKWPCR